MMKQQLSQAKQSLDQYNKLLDEVKVEKQSLQKEREQQQQQKKKPMINDTPFQNQDLEEKVMTLRTQLFTTRCDMYYLAEKVRALEYNFNARLSKVEQSCQEISEFLNNLEILNEDQLAKLGYNFDDEDEGEDEDDDI